MCPSQVMTHFLTFAHSSDFRLVCDLVLEPAASCVIWYWNQLHHTESTRATKWILGSRDKYLKCFRQILPPVWID